MLLLLALAFLPTVARAAECDETFTGTAAELADEIDGAADGTVFCIEAGTFDLPARLNLTGRNLTIRGAGATETTLRRASLAEGSRDTWVVNVNGGTITFEDLTLSGRDQIRVVTVENVSRDPARLTLRRVVVEDGRRGLEGAGVLVRSNNHLDVFSSTFRDNRTSDADGRGGHIFHAGGTGTVLVEDSALETGASNRGGAIAIDGGTLTVRRSTFDLNTASRTAGTNADQIWGGGAITVRSTGTATATIEDSVFVDNTSTGTGGAILVHGTGASLTVLRTDFTDNTATQSGGHLHVFQGSLTGTQLRLRGGSATGGGAIGCSAAACTVRDSGFWFNASGSADYGRGGGGIWVLGGTLTATRNLFCGNDVTYTAGFATLNGGGAIMTYTGSVATMRNNVYMGNTTNGNGGALMLFDGTGDTSQYETAVGNEALTACGVYGRMSGGHAVRSGLWVSNTCTATVTTDLMMGNSGSERLRVGRTWLWDNDADRLLSNQVNNEGNNVTDTDPGLPTLPSFPLATTEDCRELYDWVPTASSAIYRAGDTALPEAQRDIGATGGPDAGVIDVDDDGVSWLFDCDDDDELIGEPGALYADDDGDGFGAGSSIGTGCPGDGESTRDDDCDDDDDATFPGATEIIADGKDQSCDDLELCYVDADDDDFRTSATTSTTDIACTGAGVALATVPAGDCDDADPDTFPGATELVADGKDQSCDGLETCYEDLDDDGFRTDETTSTAVISCIGAGLALDATPDGDCDDDDDAIYPGATEVPGDGTDQSCDGEELCFQDNDGDDFRTDLVTPSSDLTCTADGLADASVPDGDCDDDDDATFPGATEIVADGKDQSCDGEETCFVDADDDGFRTDLTTSTPDVACDTAGLALDATPDGDCDDENPQINPGADELWYDGVDQDCDGWSDFDQDLDGFDSDAHERLDGTFGDDCDDLDLAINPDADEVWYDAVDQDCDDASDFDQDGDGFDARGPTRPDGTTGDDCDDLDDLVFPGVRGLTDDCEPVVEQDGSRGLPDAPADEVGPTGCACDATSPTGAGWLPLALGAALGLVRRRRR